MHTILYFSAPPRQGSQLIEFQFLTCNISFLDTIREMLAVVVVCEWSYLSWGQRMIDQTIRKDFECYEWVDLHCVSF
jgi:thiaminase